MSLTRKSEASTLGEAIKCTSLTWETGGVPSVSGENVDWHICGEDGYENDCSVTSGAGGAGVASSWLKTTVTGPCRISFQYKVQTYHGEFRVTCDSTELYSYSGVTGLGAPWQYAEYAIPAGRHELTFTYKHPGQGYCYELNGVRLDKFSVTPETSACSGEAAPGAAKVPDEVPENEADYLVVDLSGGPKASAYPVRYTKQAPDVSGDACRTTELWLRRIPAGTFMMGSPESELGRDKDETLHEVTITKDFYIGVFPCTQRQWELVMDSNPSASKDAVDSPMRPVECVCYNTIHGGSEKSCWPAKGHAVVKKSFMGRIQAKTGLVFDLPTEAQWEYACRKRADGTCWNTALNSGKNLTDGRKCPNLDAVGNYGYVLNNKTNRTVRVGSYLPSELGLYDMHGNVEEWCLDWYGGLNSDSVSDPVGPDTGSCRVLRGGSWDSWDGANRCLKFGKAQYCHTRYCRSAYRNALRPYIDHSYTGFRVAFFPAG